MDVLKLIDWKCRGEEGGSLLFEPQIRQIRFMNNLDIWNPSQKINT